MRQTFLIPLLLASLLTIPLAPTVAAGEGGDPCDTGIYLYSRNSKNPLYLTPHAEACWAAGFAGTNPPMDTRLITPGSDVIQLDYYPPTNSGPSYVLATFDGLGLDGVTYQLPLTYSWGGWYYAGPDITIDPAASGDLTVTVTWPDGTLFEAATYHTVA